MKNQGKPDCVLLLNRRPYAAAKIRGDDAHPNLRGTVAFYPCRSGTVVLAEVWGLPYDTAPCGPNIFALHIHAGGDCEPHAGDHGEMPFSSAGAHFDKDACPHPAHTGDLPPLFGNHGYAWLGVYTERFVPEDVVGRTVLIHANRDDFTSQPAGDAGARIACGTIARVGSVRIESERD